MLKDASIIIITIIIITTTITFMLCIYNYVPETNHVSRVRNVAAVLYLQFMVPTCNAISHVTHVLYFYISTSHICAQCTKWLFSVVP